MRNQKRITHIIRNSIGLSELRGLIWEQQSWDLRLCDPSAILPFWVTWERGPWSVCLSVAGELKINLPESLHDQTRVETVSYKPQGMRKQYREKIKYPGRWNFHKHFLKGIAVYKLWWLQTTGGNFSNSNTSFKLTKQSICQKRKKR